MAHQLPEVPKPSQREVVRSQNGPVPALKLTVEELGTYKLLNDSRASKKIKEIECDLFGAETKKSSQTHKTKKNRKYSLIIRRTTHRQRIQIQGDPSRW